MGDNAHAAGRECSPSVHRLRLWGLALGSASPCADCHGAGILGLTVCGVFTRICAYSFRHPHFPSLHGLVSTPTSQHGERSPTPVSKKQDQASVDGLNPDHSRRTHAGLVSYYALFKGWLLLSQPPSCHSTRTSFAILNRHSGTLAVVLGSFPLAVGHYRSTTASQGPFHGHSEFGWGWYRALRPAPIQSLYLPGTRPEALPQ
jgi:hypothetical protein